MSKIMIVEDDESLREIYGIRLTAEGYAVVSAHDGEDALAVAVRERPDLIISDVMMPKISGFDMLDILRSTPETKNIKVIMMTALSSDDQRQRGESLGADRYLVKSQVGIEDVVNVVHEVLGDRNPAGVIDTDPATPDQPTAVNPAPAPANANFNPAAAPSFAPNPAAAPAGAAPVAMPGTMPPVNAGAPVNNPPAMAPNMQVNNPAVAVPQAPVAMPQAANPAMAAPDAQAIAPVGNAPVAAPAAPAELGAPVVPPAQTPPGSAPAQNL